MTVPVEEHAYDGRVSSAYVSAERRKATRLGYACFILALALVVSVFSYWLQAVHVRQQDETIQKQNQEIVTLRKDLRGLQSHLGRELQEQGSAR